MIHCANCVLNLISKTVADILFVSVKIAAVVLEVLRLFAVVAHLEWSSELMLTLLLHHQASASTKTRKQKSYMAARGLFLTKDRKA